MADEKIPPNHEDPEPLFLGDTFAHLTQGRLYGVIRRPALAIPLGLICCCALYLRTGAALAMLGGWVASLLAASLAYSLHYIGFVHANRERGTLCPRCTSRMWQFCCARCREPVPPLASLWSGALLSRCPHCGFWLSSRQGTLLAWCSTCFHAVEHPHHFYARPTQVVVMAIGRLPGEDEIQEPWQRLGPPAPTRLTLYRPPDEHSATLMLVIDYLADNLRFAPLVIARTRLLLVADDAPDASVAALRSIFPAAPFERTSAGTGKGPP
ncbi:MAG TPA: hypothetical protein VLV54_05515 [Thermoanaerobaculia bacterium]|nr:hypothetical protein [Thermoanaerobaculia bacterium]